MTFEKQRKQADAFKGKQKSMRSFVVGYDIFGEYIDGDEVLIKRSAGVICGCRYMVKTHLLKTANGEWYYLERCFAALDDAKAYAQHMRDVAEISCAYVFKLNDRGAGSFYRYESMSPVATIDF